MGKQNKEKPVKFSRVYEDDECIETWNFNLAKFSRGPIEVLIVYKPEYLKKLKEEKKLNK